MCLCQVASSHTSSASSSNRGGVDAEELVQKMQLLSSGVRGWTSIVKHDLSIYPQVLGEAVKAVK